MGSNVPTLPFTLPTGGAEPSCVSQSYPEKVNSLGPITDDELPPPDDPVLDVLEDVPLEEVLPEDPLLEELPDDPVPEPLPEVPLLDVPLPEDPVLEAPLPEPLLPEAPL
jgi:hypothetical protein